MRTLKINDPDGTHVGTVYEYHRQYYHTTPSGMMHGPWATAALALSQWCRHHRRDVQYFSFAKPTVGIPHEARTALAIQRRQYYS